MRRILTLVLLSAAAALAAPPARDVTLVVDPSRPADGRSLFHRIGDALAYARNSVPAGQPVVIRVREGAYEETLLIDRSDTTLLAESQPFFDRDGYLAGFRRPVTVFVTRALNLGEDVVRITADRVTFRGFHVSGGGLHPQGNQNAGVRVTGHVTGTAAGERIVRDALITECQVSGIGDSAFWLSQCAARVERCRAVDPKFLGVFGSGADFVLGPTPRLEVAGCLFARSDASICIIGAVWEFKEGFNTHGAGGVAVVVENNLLLDATVDVFPWMEGHHINLMLWGDLINSPRNVHGELDVLFRNNRMGASLGPAIKIRGGEDSGPDATGLISVRFEGNSFLPGSRQPPVADLTMHLFEGWYKNRYVYNHTILASDPDGLLPPGDVLVDPGPERNGNRIVISR